MSSEVKENFTQVVSLRKNCEKIWSCMHTPIINFSGHTDVVMGAAVTNDDKLAERLRFLQNGKIKIMFNVKNKINYM